VSRESGGGCVLAAILMSVAETSLKDSAVGLYYAIAGSVLRKQGTSSSYLVNLV